MVYNVNRNAQMRTGEHIIHTNDCKRKPKNANIIELGDFNNPLLARCEAAKYYACINGCKYCCKSIHLKR